MWRKWRIMITLEIVRFCAIECEHQGSGELSVYNMVNAWDWAQTQAQQGNPTLSDVEHLGMLVEPKWNKPGFRTVDVRVGWDVKIPWYDVPKAMNDLILGLEADMYAPEQFFWEYEQIHPWRDGNGRSGAILFSWLSDTLEHPKWPPNYWNDPRRKSGYGAP